MYGARQYGFRMELYCRIRQRLMFDPHDDAILRQCRNIQTRRNLVAQSVEGMISCHLECFWQSIKYAAEGKRRGSRSMKPLVTT